jgi:DNA-binding NtrC family response regulator
MNVMLKKVLIVDDDVSVANTIAQMLVPAGYDVHQCHESIQALAQLDQKTYGCVLLDIRMPKLDGTELLPLVKKSHPDLPIIIVSAFVDETDSQYYSHMGAFGTLPKPFSPERLLDLVKEATGFFEKTHLTLTSLRLHDARDQVYRKLIIKALTQNRWNKVRAAQILGISRYALLRWLERLHIQY